MNHTDLEDLTPADRAFARAARVGLRNSESLNYVESARLSAARAQARALLQPERHQAIGWAWLAAPAAVAAIAVSLVQFKGPTTSSAPETFANQTTSSADAVNAASADALMWVSDEAGPDFYRDLEFYQWLQSRSPTEPNA